MPDLVPDGGSGASAAVARAWMPDPAAVTHGTGGEQQQQQPAVARRRSPGTDGGE